MIWQYLFWAMVVVNASLVVITLGALKYGRKLERELAEARDLVRRAVPFMQRLAAVEEPFPENWST